MNKARWRMHEEAVLTKLNEITELLKAILVRLDNLDTLDKRREQDRLRVAKCRASKHDVTLQKDVTLPKENEDGKENTSPTPLIREKGEAKRNNDNNNKTRAREEFEKENANLGYQNAVLTSDLKK